MSSIAPSIVTVLVVEDDVFVRMDAAESLELAGYRVLEARCADDALAVLARHPEVEIVFTDIDMPGSMDGLELAHRIAQRRPPLPVLVTSGHTTVSGSDMPAPGRFLPKPYSPDTMVHHIGALCRRSAAH